MNVFAFTWPSIAYDLDILAWDLFFPLGAQFTALAVQGVGLSAWAFNLLLGSAALAFLGLAGVPIANMNVRNVDIVGYVAQFPTAVVLLASRFLYGGSAV